MERCKPQQVPQAAVAEGDDKDTPGTPSTNATLLPPSSARSLSRSSARSASSAGCSSNGSDFINDQFPEGSINRRMKVFVKSMVRGREMGTLDVDGQLHPCICSFDKKVQSFRVQVGIDLRKIPLGNFMDVHQGLDPKDLPIPLDELCTTIVLRSGECITLRLANIAEREEFAMCLQIISDSHS